MTTTTPRHYNTRVVYESFRWTWPQTYSLLSTAATPEDARADAITLFQRMVWNPNNTAEIVSIHVQEVVRCDCGAECASCHRCAGVGYYPAPAVTTIIPQEDRPVKTPTPTTLDDLLDTVTSCPGCLAGGDRAEHTCGGLDWTFLPTFGGEEPRDTSLIWSWDADRLLVGTCPSDLRIVPRETRP